MSIHDLLSDPIIPRDPDAHSLDIIVAWDDFGWIATSPDASGKSVHCPGPRVAAVYFADHAAGFGPNTYNLTRAKHNRHHYIATKRADLDFITLSVRQPWAWLIIHARKDAENRTWRHRYTGPCLIHAAKTMTRMEYQDCQAFLDCRDIPVILPDPDHLVRGTIIGRVQITGCVNDSDSPWFVGPYAFELANPRPITPIPCSGKLGFYIAPETVRSQISNQQPTTNNPQ